MAKRKFRKNEIPPSAGLDLLPHLMVPSSTFLMPKFLENLIKRPFNNTEKIVARIPKIIKKVIMFVLLSIDDNC
jgi:hypothetical protein